MDERPCLAVEGMVKVSRSKSSVKQQRKEKQDIVREHSRYWCLF
jgi:hypothetical protein